MAQRHHSSSRPATLALSPSLALPFFHHSWMHEISEGTENSITLSVSFLLGIHSEHWHSLWRTLVQNMCVGLPSIRDAVCVGPGRPNDN